MENVVLVDNEDNPIGAEGKWEAHKGSGKQHRAFSVWVFDNDGNVLVHRRSAGKPLWAGYWTNSYCSHPRERESYEQAARRRGFEELGMDLKPKLLGTFRYHASFKVDGELIGSENELCALLYVISDQKPRPNPAEIAEVKFIGLDELREDMERNPEDYTPWFRMEMPKIMNYLKK